MAEERADFSAQIAPGYDRNMGPVLFEPFAREMAARVAAAGPRNILEVAAGTGIVTRQLRERCPRARLVATDLSAGMLEVARAKFESGGGPEFAVADAAALPFPDAAFDAVVCQFGFMFFREPARALGEAFRVLDDGGTYFLSVFAPFERNPLGQIAQEAIDRSFAPDPPQFFRVPFRSAAIEPMVAGLREAGFAEIAVEEVNCRHAVDLDAFAAGAIRGGPIAQRLAELGADLDVIEARVRELAAARLGPSRELAMQALFYTARRS